jgi:hypothetical protein
MEGEVPGRRAALQPQRNREEIGTIRIRGEEVLRGKRSPAPSGGKIRDKHIDRLAVVYVRQSTVQQVGRHQESTRLQYSLVDRAVYLGWQPQRVVVIDEDLGQSRASAAGRPGFQRLVAEVGLDHVGIVIGLANRAIA